VNALVIWSTFVSRNPCVASSFSTIFWRMLPHLRSVAEICADAARKHIGLSWCTGEESFCGRCLHLIELSHCIIDTSRQYSPGSCNYWKIQTLLGVRSAIGCSWPLTNRLYSRVEGLFHAMRRLVGHDKVPNSLSPRIVTDRRWLRAGQLLLLSFLKPTF
jgi:hypothetical protein